MAAAQVNTAAAAIFAKQRWGLETVGVMNNKKNSDHSRGLAIDPMINNFPAAIGKAKGDAIAAWFIANAQVFGSQYVIWDRRIADERSGWVWKPYSGASDHTDHVHISFKPNYAPRGVPAGGGQTQPVGLTTTAQPVGWLPSISDVRGVVLTGLFAAAGLGLLALGAWKATSTMREKG